MNNPVTLKEKLTNVETEKKASLTLVLLATDII